MTEAIDPLRIYTAEEVARIVLRHDVTWFYRHRRQLRAQGFPQPRTRGHGRWLGAALIEWLQRPADAAASLEPGGKVVDYSAHLKARAAAVAAGTGARGGRRPS